MTGDSILFARSDIMWQQKRKALSAALYKEKLRGMIDIIKEVTINMIRSKWMLAKDKQINIVSETSNLFINIILSCLFGAGYNEIKITQRENGVESE